MHVSILSFVLSSVLLAMFFAQQTEAQIACTGACAALTTNFDPATATVCQQLAVNVTCQTTGNIYGGSVYATASDVSRAAFHAGLCADGEAKTVYLYWAGLRQAFYPVRRSATSGTSGAAGSGYGVLVSNGATCPTWLTDKINYIQNIEAFIGGAVCGSTYYCPNSRVDSAMLHADVASSAGQVIPDLYLHDVGTRNLFYASTRNGILSTAVQNLAGFALSTSSTPPTVMPTVTPITVVAPSSLPMGTFYGTGLYRYDTVAEISALHSGNVWLSETKLLYFHYARDEKIFLSATQSGLFSRASVEATAVGAYEVNGDPFFPPMGANVIRVRLSWESTATICYGYGQYRYDSDLTAMAVLQDLLLEGDRKTLYVHLLGQRSVFYAVQKYWMTCGGSQVSNEMIMVTESPTVPSPSDQRSVKLRFTNYANKFTSVFGARVYRFDSHLEKAAFHMGVLDADEEKTLFVHPVWNWDFFYSATLRGITSSFAAGGARAFTLSQDPNSPTDLSNPLLLALRVDASSTLGGNVYGCVYYHRESDIMRAAVQQKLLDYESNKTIYLHRMTETNRRHWYPCTNNAISSQHSGERTFGYMLSTDAQRPALLMPLPIELTLSKVPPPNSAYGTNVYKANSDITAAAFHARVIKMGETRTVYLTYLGRQNCFYAATIDGYATSYASLYESSYTLSATSSFPIQAALSPIHQVLVSPSQAWTAPTHFGVQPFSTPTPLDKAALHSNFARPGQTKTLYVHHLRTVNYFHGGMGHGINQVASSSTADGYLLQTTTIPSGWLDNTRPVYLCFDRDYMQQQVANNNVYGTIYYRMDSNLVLAAYHDNKLNFRTCKNLWVHYIGMYTNFFGSGSRDFNSKHSTGAAHRAMMITENYGPAPTPPPSTGFNRTFGALILKPTVIDMTGCGVYRANTDLQLAAFHMNYVGFRGGGSSVNLYVHVVQRSVWLGCTSRGLQSFSSLETDAGFYLSTNATRPSWLDNPEINYVDLSWNLWDDAVSSFFGTRVYRYDSDVLTAAVHEYKIRLQERKAFWIHLMGNGTNFYSSTRNALRSGSSFDTSYPQFIFSDNETSPLFPVPVSFTLDIKDYTSKGDVYGCQWYKRTSDLTMTAVHRGLAYIGSGEKTIYIHEKGLVSCVYSCYQNGITSNFEADGGGQSVVALSLNDTYAPFVTVNSTSVPPNDPTWSVQHIQLKGTSVLRDNTMTGAGYYLREFDVTQAAVLARFAPLAAFGESFFIHDIGEWNRWYRVGQLAIENFNSSAAYYLSDSAENHTVIPDVLPLPNFEVDMLKGSGNIYGAYIYRANTPLYLAAVHSGMIKMKQRKTLYVHYIGVRSRFYKATCNGLTSEYSTSSYHAYVVSANTTITLPSNTDIQPIYVRNTFANNLWPSGTTNYGFQRHSVFHTDVTYSAYADGYISWPQISHKLLYVHYIGSRTLLRTRMRGVQSRNNIPTAAYMLSFSADPLPSCVTNETNYYIAVEGNLYGHSIWGQNPYLVSDSDVGRAARHLGLAGEGHRVVVKMEILDSVPAGTYVAVTWNGITSLSTPSTAKGFRLLADDGQCNYTFPGLTTTTRSYAACSTNCHTIHWPSPASYSVGRLRSYTLVGDVYFGTKNTYGDIWHYYAWNHNKHATHAGVVQPGESKLVYVRWKGQSQIYGTCKTGRASRGVGGSWTYSLHFALTSAAPVYPHWRRIPFNAQFSSMQTCNCYGFGRYWTSGVSEAAAFLSGYIQYDEDFPRLMYTQNTAQTYVYFPLGRRHGYESIVKWQTLDFILMSPTSGGHAVSHPMPWYLHTEDYSDTEHKVEGATVHRFYGSVHKAARVEGFDDGVTYPVRHMNAFYINQKRRFFARSRMMGLTSDYYYHAPGLQPCFYVVHYNNGVPSLAAVSNSFTRWPIRVQTLDTTYGHQYIGASVTGVRRSYYITSDLRATAVHSGTIPSYGQALVWVWMFENQVSYRCLKHHARGITSIPTGGELLRLPALDWLRLAYTLAPK